MWTLLQSAMTKNVPFAKVPERSRCRYDSYFSACACRTALRCQTSGCEPHVKYSRPRHVLINTRGGSAVTSRIA